MARPSRWTITGVAEDGYASFDIIGFPQSWEFFVNTPIASTYLVCSPGSIKATNAIKTFKRRAYPGDPGTTIPAQPEGRKIYQNRTKKSGSAVAGHTVILSTDPETYDGGDEKRQFQLVGNFKDLAMYLESDAEKDIILYNNSGTNYKICASVGGEAA